MRELRLLLLLLHVNGTAAPASSVAACPRSCSCMRELRLLLLLLLRFKKRHGRQLHHLY